MDLVATLSRALLATERPIDLMKCEQCGVEYRANGIGHIRHIEACPGRKGKSDGNP
jgi:hypothetical protein